MYKVKVVNNGEEFTLLNKYLKLIDPMLEQHSGNSPDYFKFSIGIDHPYYDKIKPLTSVFYVYENNKEIFKGRATNSESDFHKTNKITCESDLAYLLDSIVRPYSFQGSIIEFVNKVIDEHNSQVEDSKKFEVGNITVVDTNNYINRSSSDYTSCLECLRSKLVKTHGGYIRTRYENGRRYIDYVYYADSDNTQPIRFGENLSDFTREKNATSIFTVLVPVGAKVRDTDESGKEIDTHVTIKSVNDGKDYIEDTEAIAKYGRIVKTQTWKDVTVPENLLRKAREYLNKSLYLSDTIKMTAVDLALIDSKYEHFKVGCLTQIVSKTHELNAYYMLEERSIYLQEPSKSTITLGATTQSLSTYTSKQNLEFTELLNEVGEYSSLEINRRIDNATTLISGGLGGYVVLGQNTDGQPEEILIMDSLHKENARNVVRLNKNGIGFSNTGYNGVYKNAWTIDGNLVADFITSGTMLAERVRGGTLEVGGSGLGQDGVISVKDVNDKELVKLDKDGMHLDSSVKIDWDNVEDSTDNVTQIAEDYIKTTNITAENLTVNSANILGTFSADKITSGEFSGPIFKSTADGRTLVIKDATISLEDSDWQGKLYFYNYYLRLDGGLVINGGLNVNGDIETRNFKVIYSADINQLKAYSINTNILSASGNISAPKISASNKIETNTLEAKSISANSITVGGKSVVTGGGGSGYYSFKDGSGKTVTINYSNGLIQSIY